MDRVTDTLDAENNVYTWRTVHSVGVELLKHCISTPTPRQLTMVLPTAVVVRVAT